MSQSAPHAPAVTVNAGNNSQHVPLRDYLNARVAPFLKKAVTESLGVEAEFPLQWLGECLIHQSILYEGNPDRTNIRERFLYTFEDPKPQEPATSERAPSERAPSEAMELPQDVEVPPQTTQPEVTTSEVIETTVEPTSALQASGPEATPTDAPVTNGVEPADAAKEQDVPRDEDTEMGGTA